MIFGESNMPHIKNFFGKKIEIKNSNINKKYYHNINDTK
jgi:hypothetical protein